MLPSEQCGCLIGAANSREMIIKRYLNLTTRMGLIATGIMGVLAAAPGLAANPAEQKTFEVYTTPKGTYQLETTGDDSQVFVVLKSSGQREPLPDASSEDPDECSVIYSATPDEKWIFRAESWRHHAVQGRQLYHHNADAKFAYFNGKEWFTKAIVAYATKAGGFKKSDFYEQRGKNVFEDHLNADFRGWSPDSARLLLSIIAGGDYRDETPKRWYVYFNTRTSGFELTPYLRELNKLTNKGATEDAIPCAEPIDALPAEAEIKRRAESADQELKEWFANREAHPKDNETAAYWQDTEKDWIKARDEGLQLYLQFAPEKDREQRRLQFLGDVAAVRLTALEAGSSL